MAAKVLLLGSVILIAVMSGLYVINEAESGNAEPRSVGIVANYLQDLIPDPRYVHDGVIYYKAEEIPDVQDRGIPADALRIAAHTWQSHNPNIRFVESNDTNVVIKWHLHPADEWAGLATCDYDHNDNITECVVDISIGGSRCGGGYVQTETMDLANLIMHEFGHVLDLGHTLDESHLMYSDVDPEDPFDTRGLNIPSRYPGFQDKVNKSGTEIDGIQSVLNSDLIELDINQTALGQEWYRYEELIDEYERYGSRDPAKYDAIDALWYELDARTDAINLRWDAINARIDAVNEMIDKYDSMLLDSNAASLDPCISEIEIIQYSTILKTVPVRNSQMPLSGGDGYNGATTTGSFSIIRQDEKYQAVDEYNRHYPVKAVWSYYLLWDDNEFHPAYGEYEVDGKDEMWFIVDRRDNSTRPILDTSKYRLIQDEQRCGIADTECDIVKEDGWHYTVTDGEHYNVAKYDLVLTLKNSKGEFFTGKYAKNYEMEKDGTTYMLYNDVFSRFK